MGAMIDTASRISPEQAARELKMETQSFRYLLQTQRLPLSVGYAIKKPGNTNWTYYVSRKGVEELKLMWGIND